MPGQAGEGVGIMAQLTAFGYNPGNSILHILDARFKIGSVALISVSSLDANLPALFILSVFLCSIIFIIRLPLITIYRELRYFFLFLMAIILLRAFTTPGSELIAYKFIVLSREGLHDGLIVCWRLVLIVLVGVTLIATTKPSEIKAAFEWYMKPFPFLPRKRIAVMLSLTMRFMPVILAQAKEMADAQKARCISNRRNPFYRLKKFAVPVILRSFETADRLSIAMEARCYSENRTDPEFSPNKADWIAICLVISLCALLWYPGCK
jgi:biotin transport system permease protein